MFHTLISRLYRVISDRLPCARPIGRLLPCSPTVEQLEERLVLDDYLWKGIIGANGVSPWENWKNWNDKQNPGQHTYPGGPDLKGNPTTDDTATITVGFVALKSDVVVQSLTLSAGLFIEPGHSLTIRKGKFDFQSGFIDLAEDGTAAHHGSWINLDCATGDWTGGKLSTLTGYGHVYVYNGSTLNITKDGGDTGAHLVIGQDQKGKGSAGTLNLATIGTKNDHDMESNLQLEINAGITIYTYGIMNFNQSKRSDTAGGIKGGGLSKVINYGTMNRTVPDAAVLLPGGAVPVASKLLNIQVPVLMDAAPAQFNLGAKCGINFSGKGGLDLKEGTFRYDKANGAVQKGVNVNGGKLEGRAAAPSGTDRYYALAGLPATAGIIAFDDSAGAYGNLVVSGSLTLAPGVLLSMNVGGSGPPTADLINVSGPVNLGGATLSLNVLSSFSAPPPPPPTTITLIDEAGSSPPIDGTFAGLPEGTNITINHQTFSISYHGGDGNDVVLTYVGTYLFSACNSS